MSFVRAQLFSSVVPWVLATVQHPHHHRPRGQHAVSAGRSPSPADLVHVAHLVMLAGLATAGALVLGALIGEFVHRVTRARFELLGVCLAAPTAVLGLVAHGRGWPPRLLAVTVAAGLVTVAATMRAATRHVEDVRLGGDRRRHARERTSVLVWAQRWRMQRRARRAKPRRDELVLGRTRTRPVTLPRGGLSGRHVLVVGAPGSGKTTTLAALARGCQIFRVSALGKCNSDSGGVKK